VSKVTIKYGKQIIDICPILYKLYVLK